MREQQAQVWPLLAQSLDEHRSGACLSQGHGVDPYSLADGLGRLPVVSEALGNILQITGLDLAASPELERKQGLDSHG
jgi:hypothetical protein